MKSWLCELILSCTVAAPAAPAPADLHYGTVLYSYYQQEWEDGLVEVLVAEARGRRGDDPIRFAFAERMFAYADATFGAIDPAELTDLDRMRLAFHLAREHFRRGEWDEVERQLTIIDLGKTWLGRERRHPEVDFMRAEIAVRRGDFDGALKHLEALPEGNPLIAYTLFNLGVALRTAGEHQRAAEVFARLAELDVYDAEALDIKERARVALAFVERELAESASAEEILRALPASGRYRDLALTSYGGLAMEQRDYELAARVWMSLKEQDYWTPSTAAARLAFPLSLEQLASRQAALMEYRAAEQSYEARLANLDSLANRANDATWVRGLLRVFSAAEGLDAERGADAALDEWRRELGHTDWLEWLSAENVHELMLEWRELDEASQWLDKLPEELAIYDELASEQRRRAARARELIEAEGLETRRAATAESIAALDARIVAVKESKPARDARWMTLLATNDETQRLDKVAELRTMLTEAETSGLRVQGLAERIDRAEGLVFWQIADDALNRLRVLEKANQSNRELLADVEAHLVRVRLAEARFVTGVETDFRQFQVRADAIASAVHGARANREAVLVAELRSGMGRERAQLDRYLLLTRIAIARTMDGIALGADGAGAAP